MIIPKDPIERIENPLTREVEDPSSAGLAQLKIILGAAVSAELISEKDSHRMLRLLTVNPHARLARLGQRLTLLEATVGEMKSLEFRINYAIEHTRQEMEMIERLVGEQWSSPEKSMPAHAGEL